jgi:hypothetical protein
MSEEILEVGFIKKDSKSTDTQKKVMEIAVNFLIKSRRNGIFYQSGVISYLIPIQYKLGYRGAPMRVN